MNQELLLETKFLFLGQVTTLQEFADEYCDGEVNTAREAIKILIKKGKIEFTEKSSKQENVLMNVAKEEMLADIVNQFEEDDETKDKFTKDQKRENRSKYASIELPFATVTDAQATENYIKDKFYLQTEIKVVGRQYILIVYDITDAEVNAIGRKFQLENLIDGTVNLVNKGVGGVAGAVDFTASRVLVPTLKVGANAGVAVAKTAVNTVAKTGSMLLTSIIKGTKQAKKELSSDREVLSAVNELVETKDAIARQMNSLLNSTKTNSAIKINK